MAHRLPQTAKRALASATFQGSSLISETRTAHISLNFTYSHAFQQDTCSPNSLLEASPAVAVADPGREFAIAACSPGSSVSPASGKRASPPGRLLLFSTDIAHSC